MSRFRKLRELLEDIERALDGLNSFKLLLNRLNPDELLQKLEDVKVMLAALEKIEKQVRANLEPPVS